jgi:hypothetical protein
MLAFQALNLKELRNRFIARTLISKAFPVAF